MCREGRQKISTRTPDKNPAISVIIPAFNAANFIGDALDSVFAQTFTDHEVIVINDGSPDSKMLEQALQPYGPRIVYLKQPNRGPSAARNLGIRHACGEFLAFLDADDSWLRDYLTDQIRLFEQDPTLGMVFSDVRFFGDSRSAGRTHSELYPIKGREFSFEALLGEDPALIFPSAVVARRNIVISAGLFDEGLRHWEDLDLWARIALGGARIAFQSKPLVNRRAHAASLSRPGPGTEILEVETLEWMAKKLVLGPDQRSALLRRIARRRASADLREARKLLAAGDFGRAGELLVRANHVLNRRKLRMAILGLRVAPLLTRFLVGAWQVVDRGIELGLRGLRHLRT